MQPSNDVYPYMHLLLSAQLYTICLLHVWANATVHCCAWHRWSNSAAIQIYMQTHSWSQLEFSACLLQLELWPIWPSLIRIKFIFNRINFHQHSSLIRNRFILIWENKKYIYFFHFSFDFREIFCISPFNINIFNLNIVEFTSLALSG